MRLIKMNDKEFPDKLRKIKNAPTQIWADGNISLLNNTTIAIVGSRNCTEYGEKWCETFTKGFIEYDLTIVSGMAVGIDTVAHKTALKYKGKTIAVLPCGFNHIYPEENVGLYKEIIQNGGLIISEFAPNENESKENFLKRNRIVSGLSIGVLVVEAAYRSGTSVTARLAREQGKEAFCIPGSLDNSKSLGTNRLIQKGAKLVTCVEDIVECYGYLSKKIDLSDIEKKIQEQEVKVKKMREREKKKQEKKEQVKKEQEKKEQEKKEQEKKEQEKKEQEVNKKETEEYIEEISEEYKDIYKLIAEKPRRVNEIAKILNIPVSEVMSKTTMLELEGKIERKVGDTFFATSGNIRKHPQTSANIRKHPETSGNIRKHPETSENIRKHPETSGDIRKHIPDIQDVNSIMYGNPATNLVLEYIRSNGQVSKSYILDNLNLTDGQIKYSLKRLQEKDKIEKIGKGKDSYYIIKE